MQEMLVAGAIVVGVLNLLAGVLVSVVQLRRVGRPELDDGPPPGPSADRAPTAAIGDGDADLRAAMMLGLLHQLRDKHAPLPAAAPQSRAAAARKNLLLIEDDVEMRDILAQALALDGHAVRTADNGVDGLALAREEHDCLSLVLLDLGLATMNGFEFLAAQSSDPSIATIPVVVISGRPNLDDIEHPTAWVHTLHKPTSVDELADVVKRFAR